MRKEILINSNIAGACHIGSALSCVEILQVIHKVKKKDDVFLFAKASGVAAYYCLLAEQGIIPKDKVAEYLRDYPLPSKEVPGVVLSCGSCGHGLNVAVGMAFADREHDVYCLIGDGELNEGSTWEAMLFAGHHKLKNLKVVVDYNHLQACGRTEDILDLEPLEDKFEAFNWHTFKTGGHNKRWLEIGLTLPTKKPIMIIADTTKGKGVDFLENRVDSHYKNLDNQLLQRALEQL